MGFRADQRRSKFLPNLFIDQVQDQYTKRNFQALVEFFDREMIMLGFRFIEFTVSGASANKKIAHGLGYIPKDIIVTRITGDGDVTFNYSKFSNRDLDVTTDGSVKVRAFVGTYKKEASADNELLASTETQTVSPDPTGSGASAASSSSTTSSTTTESTLSASAGMLQMFAGPVTNIPSGWLYCDGSTLNRADYPDLYAAIGTAWGAPSATTFKLPDMRGLFPRGLDDRSGVSTVDVDRNTRTAISSGGNTGPAVGSYQVDQFKSHTHSLPEGQALNPGSYMHYANTNYDPTLQSGATGGSETRPKNAYVVYMIKT